MTLWKRATGAIKDKNSLILANFSRRTSFRNPDLEGAIIKATSHDEYHIEKRNAQIVFSWIRASPISLRPLVWALSNRMEKTRSWVVAIKGLMLMHGIFHCKVPAVQKMGRLPFDLSSFSDGHSRSSKAWGFNAFIREYFAFLDRRAVVWFEHDNRSKTEECPLMVQQLSKLQKWQSLLDMLLQIRPRAENMKVLLILEAMDCVIIEIFDVYSRICSEIAKVLLKIHSVGKLEAVMALKILQKATTQGEELSLFFEFCKEYGVLNANEFPTVTHIPEEDVQELERIINGDSAKTYKNDDFKEKNQMAIVVSEENSALCEQRETRGALKTIITDKWVVFDENIKINGFSFPNEKNTAAPEEAAGTSNLPLIPIDDVPVYNHHYEIPDLISF
ncbi:putative clathrin assembly protein At1g25240 [Durio zibethinus]|uniref:Clathrin assembly protein At1g25240 n=1 Tax=Durio zibethinus TaxID=66656 RepID=A0A6P6BHG0_DURZI|nr:putative clathrin assembly protein At1g25240 [Durio zibethinus]